MTLDLSGLEYLEAKGEYIESDPPCLWIEFRDPSGSPKILASLVTDLNKQLNIIKILLKRKYEIRI